MPALSLQFKFALGTGSNTATSVAIPSTSLSSDGNRTFKSATEKGPGYFGTRFATVSYTVTPNFVGTLTTQATLATDPIEKDWFDVSSSTVVYPDTPAPIAQTTTNFVNFIGNFTWVRAVVQRNVRDPNGSVQAINYNF